MSLPLPRLDDRVWQDLRDEGVSLISRFAPTWTDHNVTDPGITLIELLAYQTEVALYRLNQIGEPHRRAFLRLIGNDHLPAGPRPATTLLQFEPQRGQMPSAAESWIVAGRYFVPRLSPKAAGQRAEVLGVGESIARRACVRRESRMSRCFAQTNLTKRRRRRNSGSVRRTAWI